MPKVSVIIPVYGVEKYIERCARSLFEQTLDDIEFIFVDDCTPDKSIEILRSIIEEYRLRFVEKKYTVRIERMPTNSGLAAVRRHGIQLATGDYITFCDSDDWVDIDLYESMYSKAIAQDLDIVCCDFKKTDGSNHLIKKGGHFTNITDCIYEMLYRKMSWSLCNKMFKRSLFSNEIVYPKDAMGEDLCICLQLFQYAKSVGYTLEKFYCYYTNPNSIVNKNSPDQCLSKYGQLKRNLEIVKSRYKHVQDKRIRKGLIYLSFYRQEVLVPAVGVSKEVMRKWRDGITGCCLPVILDNNVLIKERIKAILILLHVYPHI